jgi:hypothetical protein
MSRAAKLWVNAFLMTKVVTDRKEMMFIDGHFFKETVL